MGDLDEEPDHLKAQKLQTLVSCLNTPFYFGTQSAAGVFQTWRCWDVNICVITNKKNSMAFC